MLYAELKNRTKLTLRETSTHRYILYSASKEETKYLPILYEKYKNNESLENEIYCDILDRLNLCGNIEDVNHFHIKDIIPIMKTHKMKAVHGINKDEEIEEYECYQQHKLKIVSNNVIVHEDRVGSFRCACDLIRAENFIVLKEPKYIAGIDPYEENGRPSIKGEVFVLHMKEEYFNNISNDGTNQS